MELGYESALAEPELGREKDSVANNYHPE